MRQLSNHILSLVVCLAASFTAMRVAGCDDYMMLDRDRLRPQEAVRVPIRSSLNCTVSFFDVQVAIGMPGHMHGASAWELIRSPPGHTAHPAMSACRRCQSGLCPAAPPASPAARCSMRARHTPSGGGCSSTSTGVVPCCTEE